jgi:hypothetical protein
MLDNVDDQEVYGFQMLLPKKTDHEIGAKLKSAEL